MKLHKTIRFFSGILILNAVFMSPLLVGKHQILEIDQSPFVVNLEEGKAPVHIHQVLSDADVSIQTHDFNQIIIIIDDFDDESSQGDASLVFDPTGGNVSLSLKGDLVDSDVVWIIPETASVSIQSEDGDILICDIAGDIECSSSDGDIELKNISGRVSAASKDGDILIHISEQESSNPISASTDDGDIMLALPPDPDIKISASTIDGEISCDFPFQSGTKSGANDRHDPSAWRSIFNENTLTGILGSGTRPIQLNTADGDILIVQTDFQ